MQGKTALSIFWFRRDLRLEDNRGLYQALKAKEPVLPVFIFDKNILGPLQAKDDARVTFIYETLKQLKSNLEKAGSSLFVVHETPEEAFAKLTDRYHVKAVYTNHDYEPYAIERDKAVEKLLAAKGVPFHSFKDQVVFEKNEVVKSDSTPYTVFTPYSKVWKAQYRSGKKERFPSEKHLDQLLQTEPFDFPTLGDLGFVKSTIEMPSVVPDKEIIRHYDETRNIPGIAGTTKMGIHLRFGTVSVRMLAAMADKLNEQWLNELIWREFFMMILWHFPHVVTDSFKAKYDLIEWRNNEKEFDVWCKGETGYPMVDAGMRELNETGFMHNRVRMVVASFLTKHLLIDWRWGEAYFAEKLLDYELSSNNGNWQWCAGCGCDAAPYFRIFNPAEQQKKFDPDFKYIRTWIPDFKPGYLPPVVEHDMARKRVLEVYQKALKEST